MQILYDHYYEPLYLYVFSIVKDSYDADDILQNIFIQLWESDRLLNFDGNLENFLFQCIRYKAFNLIRNRQRRLKLYQKSSAGDTQTTEHPYLENNEEEKDYLYRIINQLPEGCRNIFFMATLQQKKYKEIADELDISINTVKLQMKIAFKFLRQHLDKDKFSALLFIYLKNH